MRTETVTRTEGRPLGRPRFLAICNVDVMAGVLLRPWLNGLRAAGYEVHVGCAPGPYNRRLAQDGFILHPIPVRRSFNPLANLRAILQAYRLIRDGHFDVVNTHSPIGAAVGRVSCWLARSRPVIYTVHGFYFHDRMPALFRKLLIGIEWILGGVTDGFMFVSEEDRVTATRLGIVRRRADATTIYNGVDLEHFRPAASSEQAKRNAGFPADKPVIGIVGRIAREKGYREFLEMARGITQSGVDARFLVIGDSLCSDRDRFGEEFRHQVSRCGLSGRFVFTGFIDNVADYLRAMDVFVLPSYREGFPRSILEAMATGLPVVATDIRGCREAVVHGATGLIVPPRDARALREAVSQLLRNPHGARQMGAEGRARACSMFAQEIVQSRFVRVFDKYRRTR